MQNLVVVLALLVAAQYVVIAVVVVPRLAGIARLDRRILAAARWGATAFFLGCAITHATIALQTLDPRLPGGMDMAVRGGNPALLLEMIVPHIAQIIGGGVFIYIAVRRLEVSITSKEQATELRDLDRQFQSVFQRAPLGFALSPPPSRTSGAIYLNPAYREIYGLDPQGSPVSERDLLEQVHPDDRAAVDATMSGVVAGVPVDAEFRIVRPDGVVRWVHSRLIPIADGDAVTTRATTVLEDITERVQAHAALARSEQRFVQLANSVKVGITLRQLHPPQFLWANAAYVEIAGLDPTQDASTPVDPALCLVHPDDRDRVLNQYWPRAQRGLVAESEHRVLRPDGAIRWIHVTSNPVLDDDGAVTRVAGTVEDVTVRKEAQEVRAAQLDAERANAAKSEFLSRVSHELRTPLNAVLGYGQLLELDELSPDQKDAVSHILRGGRHLVTLIDDVLDISRLETGQLDVNLEPVAVSDLFGDVVGLMRPTAVAAGITLRHDHGPAAEAEIYVSANRRRLKQVLLNLLSNAIKYNTPGGTVQVDVNDGGNGRLRLSVTDTGFGIRAVDRPRLFIPFDRLGHQNTDVEGTGIGLSLTLRLVEAMGGDLEVESTFGQGSTFTVVLPATSAPDPGSPGDADADADADADSDASTEVARTFTVLYIEDNGPNVELMKRIVARRPHWKLAHEAEGARGLDLARTMVPTLIMLDLHLLDMHGLDVLAALKADAGTAHIPVIVLSADANPQLIEHLYSAGALRYRTKPLNILDVLSDLDEHTPPAPDLVDPAVRSAAARAGRRPPPSS